MVGQPAKTPKANAAESPTPGHSVFTSTRVVFEKCDEKFAKRERIRRGHDLLACFRDGHRSAFPFRRALIQKDDPYDLTRLMLDQELVAVRSHVRTFARKVPKD